MMIDSTNKTAWEGDMLNENDRKRYGASTWDKKHYLINVTAIQANGSPVTWQMWDASMAEAERQVIERHTDKFYKSIIRVFVNIQGRSGSETTYEYKVQDTDGIVGSFGERHRSFTNVLVQETLINS